MGHDGMITIPKFRELQVSFRVRGSERKTFEQAAELSGITLSAWMRERLRRAAIVELKEAGQQIAFLDKGSTR